MIKPVILITHSDSQSIIQLACIKLAVFIAGGVPCLISPNSHYKPEKFDALVLYGGVDIFPERYGECAKKSYAYDLARDAMEFEYLQIANDANIPTLGICRGAQLMNIYHGGDLHIDITKAYEKAIYPTNLLGYIFFRKKILIKNGSLLSKLVCRKCINVNSIHRQSINRLGDQLTISAYEENGVIQSVEDMNKYFYMGVQFHPEFLIYKKVFRHIFQSLIQAARKNNSLF